MAEPSLDADYRAHKLAEQHIRPLFYSPNNGRFHFTAENAKDPSTCRQLDCKFRRKALRITTFLSQRSVIESHQISPKNQMRRPLAEDRKGVDYSVTHPQLWLPPKRGTQRGAQQKSGQ
jgi:hypothetical protein